MGGSVVTDGDWRASRGGKNGGLSFAQSGLDWPPTPVKDLLRRKPLVRCGLARILWPTAPPLQMQPCRNRISPRIPDSLRSTLMSLLDKLRGEFIDIVEWTEPSNNDILCYRFPRYQNEIKNGAKLTVREGQAAVFVSEGQIADVCQPGLYTLETQNLPILSTIKGWKYGFNS